MTVGSIYLQTHVLHIPVPAGPLALIAGDVLCYCILPIEGEADLQG